MKKTIRIFSAIAIMAISLTSCGGASKQEAASADSTATVSVDEVLANPQEMLGKTITIEGVCSHLCQHGGRKAFVLGSSNAQLLRCEATPAMGGAFSKETIHKPICVTGILREERIDEAAVKSMEEQYEAQAVADGQEAAQSTSEAVAGCDTERQARGQGDLKTFEARMKDYRIRIAERDSLEGKPYLSFYYLESSAYEILPE